MIDPTSGVRKKVTYNGFTNVHPDAQIGENVTISPFVTIEDDVIIGDDCWIGPNVTIMSGTRIGNGCRIFPGAVLGAIPQDLKFEGEYTTLEIGDYTTIREYCTLNRGTRASGRTVIGSHCLLMAYVHVAHDCVIGDHCILANNVNLAGHITVGDYAVLGGLVAVHQFVHIGRHSMISGGSLVGRDVPPYVKAAREPLSYAGVNRIGLKRRGFSQRDIHAIQDIYRYIFVKNLNLSQAVEAIRTELPDSPFKDEILQFIATSERGLIKGFRRRERAS